jgi:hypothetical protein
MADTKISALTAATTPLSGTEVLPIVQSGATVKVANNDLRPKQIQSNATSGVLQVAGPASASTRVMTTPDANFTVARTDAAQSFTGNQTLSTGNLVIGTSGQGIDFSATPGTGTSELLADYEEGNWTPIDGSGAGLTFTVTSATYTKVGRLVYVQTFLTYPVTANGAAAVIGGLPFTVALDGYVPFPTECGTVSAGSHLRARTASTVADFLTQTFAQVTNVTISGQTVIFAGVYST